MRTWRGSFAAKTVAWILLIISGVMCVCSIVVIGMCTEEGVYEESEEEHLRELLESINQKYSVHALADMVWESEESSLADTHFQYGIIQKENLAGLNLNDKSLYLEQNFTEEITDKNMCVFSVDISPEARFEFRDDGFWEWCYVYSHVGYELTIDHIYYDTENDIFYYANDAKNWVFPVERVGTTTEEGVYGEREPESIQLDGYSNFMADIEPVTQKDLAEYELVENSGYERLSRTIYVESENLPDTKTYWVVSVIPEMPIEYTGSWLENDLYVKACVLNDYVYFWRYGAIWLLAGTLLVGMISFVFLCRSAGHRKNTDAIVQTWLEKMPFEIETLGAYLAEVLIVLFMGEVSYRVSVDSFGGRVCLGIFVAAGILGVCVALVYLLSFVVRVKAGKWWRNTLLWRFWLFCGRFFAVIRENTSLFVKSGAILLALAVVEFFVIVEFGYDTGAEVCFWFVEKVILYVLIFLSLCQMKKLQEGSRRIAEGDLSHRIDTTKMFWEFRKHGDNLNNISTGMSRAVDDRMKSERFKTELITNVSHDIKTPLTSIINYVDLLEKEQLDNPTVQEYLEVLERQSARLKKLIEDLMEASKASTGNLTVNLERLEAGVFMVQTVGEFEEKTKASQLELLIRKPEEPVYIMADGRHFWRVIDNLMNNICKYAQPQTRVYINLDATVERVQITFRNTSRYPLNITSEELLERFVRGDSSRNTEGSGLGLSIAQSLMELMGGKFELYVDGDLFKVVLTFARVTV